ncbi:uncharacterized protein LOC111688201 [Lucilia cuprina]|uniref:uncharacterized protein LOC111688201 n=1 Tax=Lucilia cuprina TaxID=7375 RepID=UPI001F0568A7|nr:uncharacterized protein LOC111688201 [Lucilia cuprina]
MSQNNQRKHYHIHAPYQHPQQQQQQAQHHHHPHHLTATQQQQQQHHHQQQQQQWYAPQHYQHGLHLRDSRHIQHPSAQHPHHHSHHVPHQQQPQTHHQAQHHSHSMASHMFASGYVAAGVGGGGGVGGVSSSAGGGVTVPSSPHNTATMGSTHNMPVASSPAHHYSSAAALAGSSSSVVGAGISGGPTPSNAPTANSAAGGAYAARNRIFDLEMLTTQSTTQQHAHSSSAASHSHSMLSTAAGSSSVRSAAGFDAYSHNSLYSQPNQRHHSSPASSSHHHLAAASHSLHPHHSHHHHHAPTSSHHPHQTSLHQHHQSHHHHQQQQHQQQQQQHYYHHAPPTSLHRPHSQVMPPMLQHIKSEPVEQITVTPSIQTEEIIIKCKLYLLSSLFVVVCKIRRQCWVSLLQIMFFYFVVVVLFSVEISVKYLPQICCISVTQRDQLFVHLNEHKYQPRFDCCICRLCFQTSLELHDHYINNEDFCGKFYDKEAFKKPITSSSTSSTSTTPYLGKPESSNLEIAHTFSLKDIPPANSQHLEALYNKPSSSKTSMEAANSFGAASDFPLEPQVEVKTEIKVEPDFYPPMDQSDFPSYDNDYPPADFATGSNPNLAFLQDFQDNASSSTNSSYSFNNNDAIQDEDAICCVPKCGVRKFSSPSLQFFGFPRDEKYLAQWLHNLKMIYDPNVNYGLYRICSLHFPKRCIAKYSLSYWAVPTFNLGHDDVGNLYQNRESSGGFPAGEMAKCSMPGCPSQRGETNVKFHVFPRDLKTLIKWCQNSRLPVHSKDNRFFCSRHFEEKCFGKFRLKPWAIPTLNLGTVYGKIHDNPNIYQEEKKCFLPFCRRSRSYDCNLSLYRFPRDETLLRRWCYNLRLDPNMYRGKNHKICSSHFIKEALGLRKLNPGAVPTLNLGHNDRFNIYENELYTPPPPPPPQPSTSSKAHKYAELFKQEMAGSSHIYDGVFMNASSMVQKYSSSAAANSNNSNNLDLGDVCLVPTCKRTRHSADITLHTVPKRPEQLKKWCHNLKMDLVKMHKSVRICSAHFEKYCIGGCMRPFAVPTLELGHDDTNIYRNPDVIKKLNIRETCCIQTCKRNRDRDHANLHRFPTHPELLQKWCENLQKPIPDGTKLFNDAVCEIHFEDRCLRNKRLEKWAIPTLNLGWDEAPHALPSEEEINENWVKPFAPNNGDEQGECCVVSCKRNPQIDDVKLYRPPEDAEQLVKWAHNLQVDVAELPNMKICNLHFEQHCIGKRLLNWAMPTLNLGAKVEHLFENPPPMPTIYKKKIKPERLISSHEAIKWSPRCCLPHCRKMRSVDKVHLFRFPYNNRQTLAKWCHNLQLPLVGSSHRRICSSHFESSVLTKRCPMSLAVPTLDLNAPPGYKIYQNPARLKQIKIGSQRKCIIESCGKTKLDGVSLFRFPNNRSILYKWRHNIKNWPKGKLSSQLRICAEHFEPHSVGERKLSPGAIPTLKLGHDAKDLYPNETRSFFDLEKCVVNGCDSRKDMEDIRLFRFPRDDDVLLKKWCNNLKMETNDCVGIKICSKHFETECIGPRQLYKWAIPTLKLGHQEDDLVDIIPNPPPEQRAGEFLFKCCVPTCGKTRKYDEAQMNSFPKNLKLFRKWKHNLKLDYLNFKEREKYKICNDHFEAVCVGKTRLNFGALPTLNLGHDDVDDLYQINPDRIRPNLFIKQKDAERLERRRILREENREQYECEEPEEDNTDPLSLEPGDIKCYVSDCSAPKSIMREPYELPQSKEFKELWLKELGEDAEEDLPCEARICGLHFQNIFNQLKEQMLELAEENPDLKSDFQKLQYNYQKSNISLVVNSYQCRVADCATNLLNSSIRLFFFPYGKNLVNKWSHNTGIIPDEHRRYMNKVCALHFESYCITENQRLRSWAIPTLNLPLDEDKHLYKNPDLTKLDRRMLGPQIVKCAVKNCSYQKSAEDDSIKLFNFPCDDKLLKKWCDNLKMSHHFTPLLKICSLHFEKQCFGSCRIRSWAIPTLNLGHDEAPEHLNKTTIRQELFEAPEQIADIQLKQVKIKKSLDSAKCYIASCRKSRLKHGVRFYSLPSNPKMKRKWLHNLQISQMKSSHKLQNVKICNHHFHKRCLEGKQLKAWAVPTMHLGHTDAIFDNPRKVQSLQIQRCVLAHCKNHTMPQGVRLFVFPKSPEFLEKWSKNLKLELEKCKGKICHEHFEKEVIGEKKLKNGAVPTLNLGHDDEDIYDNKELKEKMKLKSREQEVKVDPLETKEITEELYEEEYEPHSGEEEEEEEEEDEELWETDIEEEEREKEEEEEEELEEEEVLYYDEEEGEEEDVLEEQESNSKRPQEDDELSVTTSITDWSSIKFKEVRVAITPLTPEDLMDLCSRSSYEREFGCLTPASSLRGRRSITPASSLKELRSETPEQKPNSGQLKLRSETPDNKSFFGFREPRSVTPDQKADQARVTHTPEPKLEKLNDNHNETKNISTSNTLKRDNTETNSFSVKRERLELSEDENTNTSLPLEMDYANSTNLRTDKALNAVAPICCLKHCGKEKTPEQHLTTYGFPKDPQLLQKWCDNLGLQPDECIGRVCIDHFELRVIGTRRLRQGAVPTLNLGPNRQAKHSNSEEMPPKKTLTKDCTETVNLPEADGNLKPPPPYKHSKTSKQSVFRLCCLKHCRRKKFVKPEKKEKDLPKEPMAMEQLFKFPTDENTLKKWYKNLRLPEKLSIPNDLQICAKHFESNCIIKGKLHPKAVPTLKLSYANREPIYKNNPKDFETFMQKSTPKEKCFLKHCGNVNTERIFLIPFLDNESMSAKKWCKNLRIPYDRSKLKKLKICSEHFEPYVFYKRCHLRNGALPTLNLGHTEAITRNCRKLRLKRVNSNSVKEQCCIEQCKETNLKLYAFPRSFELRKIWCNNLQIELRQALNNHYKVCSKHFGIESFMVGSDNLKINAVPVLNLGIKTESHLVLSSNPQESKCLVENCQKTPSVDKVKLFKMPQKPEILKKWLFNLNLSAETYNPQDVICSKHFDKSCIKQGLLHENAIPTKFLEIASKDWFYKNNEELYEMPRKCCVLNCQQTSEEAKHLYRFPKHKEDLEKWLYNLKLQVEESEVKDLRVCDKHFEQSCKISNKDLITQALPTLNLGHTDSDIYGNNFIKCCLDNCTIEGFYYHKLPEDLMLQSFWFQELEMETTYNTSLYICSVHFVAFFERILEKYSAFLKESKEYVKLSLTYNELKALPGLQSYKCNIPKCNSGFKLIWKLLKFPKDQTLFNKWLHNTGLKFDYDQRNNYRICAQHFEERCLSEKKLHRWSLPTLKLPFNNSLYVNPPEALPSHHENLKHCCVSNCPTVKGPFYKFPLKLSEAKKWIHNLDLGTQQCTLNLRVCYKHFENYCFSKAVDKIKPLKSWSVPTLKLKRKTELYLNPADKIAYYVCCINSCKQILNKSKEIYLFKFPSSNTLRQKWLHNLGLNRTQYQETMRICSDHFERDCFYKGYKLLRKYSVPTLCLNKPPKDLHTNPVRRPYLKCCVKLCKGPWLQLFNFPKDKTLLRKWCHNLQLEKEIPMESLREAKLCGQHFEKECFNRFGLIRAMALPTLKLGHRKKLFKNPNFNGKSKIKAELKEEGKAEEKVTPKANEDVTKEQQQQDLQVNQELDNNLESEKKETKTFRAKALRPLQHLRKPDKLINRYDPKAKTLRKKALNIKAKLTKVVKTKHLSNKAKENKTKKAKEKKTLKENKESEEQEINNLIEEKNCKDKEEHLDQVKEPESCEVESNIQQQEDAYLENLLEILTETDNATDSREIKEQIKQEQVIESTQKLLDIETEREQSSTAAKLKENPEQLTTQEVAKQTEDYLQSNPEDENTFTIYEIKQELEEFKEQLYITDSYQTNEQYLENNENPKENDNLDYSQDSFTNVQLYPYEDSQDDYLQARPDYEPSDHSENELNDPDATEEPDKHTNGKGKNPIGCCIKTCRNFNNYQDHIPFFKLPNIRKLREQWLANCKINQKQYNAKGVLRRFRICIEHFHKQCLKNHYRLLIGSVPTLKLGSPAIYSTNESLKYYSYFRCKVKCCQRSTQYDKINRIKFPEQPELKSKWCYNLNIKENTLSANDWICHRHFERKALIDCRKPKTGMLPTLLSDSLALKGNAEEGDLENIENNSKTCCVKNCDGLVGEFCKIPTKCKAIYKKWLENLKLEDTPEVRENTYVCLKHFEATSLQNKRRIPLMGSVPTLYLEERHEPQGIINTKCSHPLCREDTSQLYDWPNKGICHNIWLQINKYSWELKHHELKWQRHSETIKFCTKHFINLYEINQKNINSCKILTTNNKEMLKEIFENLKPKFTKVNKVKKYDKCVVSGCKTDHQFMAYKSFKLFPFPKTDISKSWCNNIDMDFNTLKTLATAKICELHFDNECFAQKKLLDTALPTLNLPKTKRNVLPNTQNATGKCCLKSCPNNQGLKEKSLNRLYKFPLNPQILQKWLRLTNCTNYEVKTLRICDLHFEKCDFNKNKTLKESAIPILYLDDLETSLNSPQPSAIDDFIQVKQELDNSEEWCENLDSLNHDLNAYEESQITATQLELKKFSDTDNYPLLDIKQEILEIQEEEPLETNPCSLFSIQKLEASETYEYTQTSSSPPRKTDFVISDIKSQIYLCCVQKCTNNSETPGIRLFTEFPNDSEIFIKWCFNLKIDPRNYQENQYNICQQHFETICFNEQGQLQPWSVPTLNLNLNENSFIHQNDIPEHLQTPPEQCIVYGCINPQKPLYKFPYNPDVSHKWFANLKLDYTDFRAQNYRICKRHFPPQCFEHNDSNKLKTEAVPSIYLGHTDKIFYFNTAEEMQLEQEGIAVAGGGGGVGALSNHDNSRGSSQGSLGRLISPHDLEDHDSSYFEDFEEYYGQEE